MLSPEDVLLKTQCDLALQDVYSFVRQYVSVRTGHGDYATQGIILGKDEKDKIREFANMLVDLVNDCK